MKDLEEHLRNTEKKIKKGKRVWYSNKKYQCEQKYRCQIEGEDNNLFQQKIRQVFNDEEPTGFEFVYDNMVSFVSKKFHLCVQKNE